MEQENKKKMVDFTQIEITNIEGNVERVDFAKQIGNTVYSQTKDLGQFETAREIYNSGKRREDTISKLVEEYDNLKDIKMSRDEFVKLKMKDMDFSVEIDKGMADYIISLYSDSPYIVRMSIENAVKIE